MVLFHNKYPIDNDQSLSNVTVDWRRYEYNNYSTLEEISTQNEPFNTNSNSMSSCVSQLNCFKFEILYRSVDA